jgi:hypothetical protein
MENNFVSHTLEDACHNLCCYLGIHEADNIKNRRVVGRNLVVGAVYSVEAAIIIVVKLTNIHVKTYTNTGCVYHHRIPCRRQPAFMRWIGGIFLKVVYTHNKNTKFLQTNLIP